MNGGILRVKIIDLKKKDNMKRIDYDKIKRQAVKEGISPHLIIKRKVCYRAKQFDNQKCAICKNVGSFFFKSEKNFKRFQCDIIGVADNFYADVNLEYVCDCFKNGGLKL